MRMKTATKTHSDSARSLETTRRKYKVQPQQQTPQHFNPTEPDRNRAVKYTHSKNIQTGNI